MAGLVPAIDVLAAYSAEGRDRQARRQAQFAHRGLSDIRKAEAGRCGSCPAAGSHSLSPNGGTVGVIRNSIASTGTAERSARAGRSGRSGRCGIVGCRRRVLVRALEHKQSLSLRDYQACPRGTPPQGHRVLRLTENNQIQLILRLQRGSHGAQLENRMDGPHV